jgi:outer membrane protein insertion porin family/translocation and assembly module TamA
LFPFNYGETIDALLADPAGANTAERVRDVQVLYFRGLFAGGPGSNRGYPPGTISPHAVVPFLTPKAEADRLASTCARENSDPSLCSVPIGGLTLWELSLEVRYPIYDPLSGAVFCDAADVSPRSASFDFRRLHLSCGTGLRYDTAVGPIRLDLAYRIPGAQIIDGDETGRLEGDPGDIFGAPLNVSFGIGEAF